MNKEKKGKFVATNYHIALFFLVLAAAAMVTSVAVVGVDALGVHQKNAKNDLRLFENPSNEIAGFETNFGFLASLNDTFTSMLPAAETGDGEKAEAFILYLKTTNPGKFTTIKQKISSKGNTDKLDKAKTMEWIRDRRIEYSEGKKDAQDWDLALNALIQSKNEPKLKDAFNIFVETGRQVFKQVDSYIELLDRSL